MRIKLSKDWKYDSEKGIYERMFSDFKVSQLYLSEKMKDWGRPIREVHILAVLDKLYKEFLSLTNQ